MKQIINGKVYNVETAEEIAESWNGLSERDFRHCTETLYVTQNKQFFLHGRGGAMTRYAESNGNSTWGSSRIILLTPEQALDWCATNGIDVDHVTKYFNIEEG